MLRRVLTVVLICVMAVGCLFGSATPVTAADVVNLDVPFIHQENDPPDDPLDDGSWDGGAACGAASAVMIAAYWGKLPPNACDDCNGKDYSWYVNQKYTNSYGTYYDTGKAEPGGEQNTYYGAYGYIYTGTVIVNVYNYLDAHGLVVGYDASPTENEIKAELDAGYPVYKSTTLYGGHELVIVGYTDVGNYLVNDPLNDKSVEYLWSSISSGAMVTAHPDTDQTWYLADSSTPHEMYREDTGQGTVSVQIDNLGEAKWRANEAASGDMVFPAGDWNVLLHFDPAPDNNDEFTGYIGMWDSGGGGGSWESPHASWTGDGTTQDFQETLSLDSFTVDNEKYLWFKISNLNNTGPVSLQLKVGSSNSVVISPTTDPGYPLPELSTVVLVSIGLAALGGYYVVARRRKTGGTKTFPSWL